MQIDVKTPNTTQLRDKIFQAVKKGTLETWEDKSILSEHLLTPVATQYNNTVLLRFEIDFFSDNLRISPTYWRETLNRLQL